MLRRAQLFHGKLSVRLSVTFRYDYHTSVGILQKLFHGWLAWGLRCLRSADSNIMDSKGNTAKFYPEQEWDVERKKCLLAYELHSSIQVYKSE